MFKGPIFAIVSLGLLASLVIVSGQRLSFLSRALKTTGSVTKLEARNSRCGGGKRRSKYPCTKFTAMVEYQAEAGGAYTLRVSAGSTRGHDQDVSYANKQVGRSVAVIYDPKNPEKAYEDSLFDIWGTPFILGVVQISLALSRLSSRSRA